MQIIRYSTNISTTTLEYCTTEVLDRLIILIEALLRVNKRSLLYLYCFTSDERVFRFDENNDLVEEVTLNDAEPIESERKEAEKVEDVSSAFDEYEETANTDEQQDSLFNDMNPPL